MTSDRPSICFVANYTKTFTFHAVAERLEKAGYVVFWIVVNEKLRRFLSDHYPAHRLLYLNRRLAEAPGEPVGDFKINELVIGDRVLRHELAQGRRFLINIQRPIYDFLRQNGIRYVFGELTWAHELLLWRMTARLNELGCRYLNPHTVRIPNGRFAFFTDEFQSEMLAAAPLSDTPSVARSAPSSVEKPDYLRLNDQIVRNARSLPARLARIKRFITGESIDPVDPTLITRRWLRFRLRCREELNKELYRFVRRLSLVDVGDRPFVFLALHKQPEASVEVNGRYYEDQAVNIVNIWRILPHDWLLLVKEHTNAIGDRGPGFYRRLTKLPNVYLVNEREDSHEIIRQSQLVVTVSGTVAYEAALMGQRSLTLAPTFFSRSVCCRRVGLDDLRTARDIRDLMAPATVLAGALENYVSQNSFAGVISDPLSDPRSIDPDNVRLVAEAIMQVVR